MSVLLQLAGVKGLTPPLMGFPLEFGIGVRGTECYYDVAIRWSKKF